MTPTTTQHAPDLADVLDLDRVDRERLGRACGLEAIDPRELIRREIRHCLFRQHPGSGQLLVGISRDDRKRLSTLAGPRDDAAVAGEMLRDALDPTKPDRLVELPEVVADALRRELREGESLAFATAEGAELLTRARRRDRERAEETARNAKPPEERAREALRRHFAEARRVRLSSRGLLPGEMDVHAVVSERASAQAALTALQHGIRPETASGLPGRFHCAPLFPGVGPDLPPRPAEIPPDRWALLVAEARVAAWSAPA